MKVVKHMTDEEKIKKIESIYADFERKLARHRTHVQQVVHSTLQQIDKEKANTILESFKQSK